MSCRIFYHGPRRPDMPGRPYRDDGPSRVRLCRDARVRALQDDDDDAAPARRSSPTPGRGASWADGHAPAIQSLVCQT